MAAEALARQDDEFDDRLAAVLAYPYLVANRVEEHVPAQVLDSSTFLPGYVAVEGFVIAMQTNEILCSYRVEAVTSAETIEYNRNRRDDAASALQWALEVDTRKAIQDTLGEIAGGTIEYSRNSLRID